MIGELNLRDVKVVDADKVALPLLRKYVTEAVRGKGGD